MTSHHAASSAPRPRRREKGHSPGRLGGCSRVLVLSVCLTMTSCDAVNAQVPRDLARRCVLVLLDLGHRGRRPPPGALGHLGHGAWPGRHRRVRSISSSGAPRAAGWARLPRRPGGRALRPAPSGDPAHGRPAPTAPGGDLGHQVLGLLGDEAQDESAVPCRSCSSASGAAMAVSSVEQSAGLPPPGAATAGRPRAADCRFVLCPWKLGEFPPVGLRLAVLTLIRGCVQKSSSLGCSGSYVPRAQRLH